MKGLTEQLWFQVLIAMILGVAAGLLLAPTGAGLLSETAVGQAAPWIALPGNVFLALIKMVVIPLVLSSIVLGLTSSPDPDFLKQAALRIFPYFVGTTAIAIGIGIGLTLVIEPGRYINADMITRLMEESPAAQVHMVWVFGNIPPVQFLQGIREVQLLAFSTSSSAAVMPFSMEAAERKLGVAPSIVRFIIPLGATINMDGTALYQVAAAVFLTQVFGIHLSVWSLVALAGTAVGASIGTPSTPGVGIVVLASILEGVGVPASGIALIIGVDRLLDMSRTTVNVTGDLTACTIMNRWLQPTLGGVYEAAGTT